MTYEVYIDVRHHPRHNDDDATVTATAFKLSSYADPSVETLRIGYPGSGAVMAAWESWRAQTTLLTDEACASTRLPTLDSEVTRG